jgi:hypothetical protein
MTDAELLRAAILKSGLSVRQFARQVMSREHRTLHRWLAGQPIPKAAKAFLEAYLQKRDRKPRSDLVIERTEP